MIKYYCDSCHKECEDNELIDVSVFAHQNNHATDTIYRRDLCNDCLNKLRQFLIDNLKGKE